MTEPPREVDLRVDPGLRSALTLGLLAARPVRCGPSAAGLLEEIDRTCRDLAQAHSGKTAGQIPGTSAARELYRSFGIDPTRLRPSSEALLRRVLRRKPFPRILNAVDLANLCCLLFLLPIGLYDAASIRGPVTLRRGQPGEAYRGLGKDEVHLENRPVLADSRGAFGNPTSDSLRTSVTRDTESLLMVVFAPRSFTAGALEAHLERAARLMERHLGAPGVPVATEQRIVC